MAHNLLLTVESIQSPVAIACQNKVVVRGVWLLLPHADKIKVNPISSGHNVSEYNEQLQNPPSPNQMIDKPKTVLEISQKAPGKPKIWSAVLF